MRRRRVAAVLACSAVVAMGVGAATGNAKTSQPTVSCAGAVSWQGVSARIGRVATVKGRVAGAVFAASSNGSPTFLNLGVDYPSPRRFTVVIWGRYRARFGSPERRYRGRTICVRGLIRSYRGVAQIEATSPSQIAFA